MARHTKRPARNRWTATQAVVSISVGLAVTLLSTFVGQRTAAATYPDIMGCEDSCVVAASGWPLVFVRDYTGMSVINTADMMEVWLAADRFDWVPFLLNLLFWSLVCFAAARLIKKAPEPLGPRR